MSSGEATAAGNIQRVGRYVLTRELGRGSTGIVYLAHDPQRGTDVAVKLYHGEDVRPDRAETRRKLFANEARLAGELEHPNLVPVLDAGRSGENAYIVTEYLRGAQPLSAFTQLANLLPQRRVVEILFSCAKALDYAHGIGVVHRDIKPSNILLMPDGIPKIIDFGVAIHHGLTGTQSVGGLIGSPSYMAPEQVRDGNATPLSDLYSLGVVGYEMLSGKRPFYGDNLSHLIHQIIYATPPPLAKLRSSVPSGLEQVINRAMEKDPDRRFQNGLAFAAQLARVVSDFREQAGQLDLQDRFDIARHLPFFKDFGYAEIWEAISHSTWTNFAEGDELASAGSTDRNFFVIISGEVALYRNDRQVDLLRRGETFGELALLAGRPRVTTVKALIPVLAMSIDAAQLEGTTAECQLAFNRVFMNALIRRLLVAYRGSDEE